jgi:hypothetical protein
LDALYDRPWSLALQKLHLVTTDLSCVGDASLPLRKLFHRAVRHPNANDPDLLEKHPIRKSTFQGRLVSALKPVVAVFVWRLAPGWPFLFGQQSS